MNKLTVRKQLAISFGGLAALLVGVAVISLTNFMHLYEDFENYVTGVRARSEAAHLVREAVDLRAIAARNLVLVTTAADRDAEMKTVTQAHADVASHLKRLKALSNDQSSPRPKRIGGWSKKSTASSGCTRRSRWPSSISPPTAGRTRR